MSNIPPKILTLIGRNLHRTPHHPLSLIREHIFACPLFQDFLTFDDLPPKVTTENCFDLLLIPKDHPCRRKTDTYYFDENTVLRTQTSAHQNELLLTGHEKFLVSGDVYRKDEIDRTHYPVFHQMEGLKICPDDVDPKEDLISTLTQLVEYLFPGCEHRFNPDFFPFTDPSFEVEVMFNGKWLEILGCGVIQPAILKHCGFEGRRGWAFGLGLERLAMILYKIPDIRLFWTEDARFLNQFQEGAKVFTPYPVLPNITKDISFWTPEDYAENDFFEQAREHFGDQIEQLETIDNTFVHPKTGKKSATYRLHFSLLDDSTKDPAVFNERINSLMLDFRSKLTFELR
jgi:phenylalanyl-tRNA synthetase alpha chain